MDEDRERLYRRLPQIGEFVDGEDARQLLRAHPRALVVSSARAVLGRVREAIGSGTMSGETVDRALDRLHELVREELKKRAQPSLRRVINATGVILQTNLGRAPLSDAAIARISEVARGYCSLEIDLDSGERSDRGVHAEPLILRIVAGDGREPAAAASRAALVVNNCAAATFLALNSLAEGAEVVVSRGELVEIGGGFRIPEILRKSGAILREVGTTNRTRLADYAAAINSETRLILRVHQSNFEIRGFAHRPALDELIRLGAERSIPVFEDQGTGCIAPLEELGIADQSSFIASARIGVALVCASGDKLLGGPQCGILVGEEDAIRKLRANPLYRAFRVDKLAVAALEATLLAYLAGDVESIPAIRMIALSADAIRERCERWAAQLNSDYVRSEAVSVESVVGGGTTPGASLKSYAVALKHERMSEGELAALLRGLDPPVIARVSEGRVLLDLRTVAEEDDPPILELLREALSSEARVEDCAR
jgi:L-seryl-tRNA(Ser) seleniumtransferase